MIKTIMLFMQHPMRILTAIASIALVACTAQQQEQEFESSSFSSSSASSSEASADITLDAPQAGDTVASPLVVTGEARGTWYFEASFPIRLLDANGVEIAATTAQALSDWMTTDFVPFTASLSFNTPATATGTLILENDNPSGEPQYADSILIPVAF